jgi:hypothetical protein
MISRVLAGGGGGDHDCVPVLAEQDYCAARGEDAAGLGHGQVWVVQARRDTIIKRYQEALVQQIASLQASLDMLEGSCDHEDFTTCPKFRATLERHIQTRETGARGTGVSRFGVGVGGVHDD